MDKIEITPCREGFRAILCDNGNTIVECIRESPITALEAVLDMVTDGDFLGNPITKLSVFG